MRKMSPYLCLMIMLVSSALLHGHGVRANYEEYTFDFINLPLNSSNFYLQKPHNMHAESRYNYGNGVHKFWVLASDKPLSYGSSTPRSEISITGYDYSYGVRQFEGMAYVPSGTTGVSIMQISGHGRRTTTLTLGVYNGALMYYRRQVLVDDIYDKWIKVNVVHNTTAGQHKVLIDGDLKLVVADHGEDSHYFQFGVRAQKYNSYFMEAIWKEVKVSAIY